MDIDNVDVVGTTAVETGNLSTLMNADTASKAGATALQVMKILIMQVELLLIEN